MKRNNVEFPDAFMFQFLLVCCMYVTLSGMVLLALSTSNNFVQFVFAKIPGESARGSCLGPLCVVCFSGKYHFSELDLFGFWTSDFWELATSCRKFLCIISGLCLVFCTQNFIEGCTV